MLFFIIRKKGESRKTDEKDIGYLYKLAGRYIIEYKGKLRR